MRRLFAILLLALLPFLTSSAKVRFGVKGGINVSQVYFHSGLFKGDNRSGFVLGPTLEVNLPVNFLGLDFALLYDYYKIGIQQDDDVMAEAVQYIDVPVNLTFSVGNEAALKLYLATGPQFAFNVSKTHILHGRYSLDNTMLSWNAGIGFRFLSHFHLAYTYNIGICPAAELVERTEATADMGTWLHNATHKVTLTYYF